MTTPTAHARAEALQREGCALEAIARALTAEGYPAPGDLGRWTPTEVARALAQLALQRSSSPERLAQHQERPERLDRPHRGGPHGR